MQDEKLYEEHDLFLKLQSWYSQDIKRVIEWRRQAKEDFAFYNGEQWSEEDKAVLHRNKRPLVTINRVAPLVNAVIGTEINNRRMVRFVPRHPGDAKADEILTGVGEWFRYNANAQDEESEAFADTVISGMGWVDTRIDFTDDPEGMPAMQRLDPFKMVWDAAACKSNLTDAKRLWYVDQKPLDEVKRLFPGIDEAMLDASWARGEAANTEISRDSVTIAEVRWFEIERSYSVVDPISGERRICNEKELQELILLYGNVAYSPFNRRVVKRAFLGGQLLSTPDTPLVPNGQLGWECITGYYNRTSRQFYGLIYPTKDPQRWANKFFSQVMHVLNSQAKGGILAERGAFDDNLQAEESFARADQITWLRNGALSGGAPRIQAKPAAVFPAGIFQLFEESKNSISQVIGLSSEFIGTREVNQPGVLENQRRQSSINILAYVLNNLQKYRKRQAQIILYIVQNYLLDGRLVRIVGEENHQYIQLTREICADKIYDVIVDEVPSSPNEKERTFAILQQILPIISPYLTPQMGLDILRYTPLPSSLVDKWIAELQNSKDPNYD